MNEADVRQRMQIAVEHLHGELAGVRTGRANPALVENISVTYYDQEMPVKALANITAPDAKTINIAPWDPNAVGAIEKAIKVEPNLGLNPVSDGRAIFINVPPMTEERRQQMVKQVSEVGEQAQVSLRNIRHDVLKDLQTRQKNKAMSEDEFEQNKKKLDELVQEFGQTIEETVAAKKDEVMSV